MFIDCFNFTYESKLTVYVLRGTFHEIREKEKNGQYSFGLSNQ